MHPDKKLRCLLVQPEFSAFSFWNYVELCKLVGAHTPAPPLGLITVAAILPQHWEFKLLDLNCRPFDEADWAWADLVCVGGMLPQQKGILEVIARAKRDGKFIAVGGSDPSSQPDLYAHADVLVVGEGEAAIPLWLDSWRAGQPRGVFKEKEKPDVTLSPTPRFDLLNFNDYLQVGVQYSRGCPFNCEFCDIIELFGRKPRSKTPAQLLKELDALRALGYSGSVDIVDDNFIGNKRNIKRELLPALTQWNEKNGHPFFYMTEASMNLADDVPLLEQMRAAEFRIIFMGIETPDPELLLKTQKSQNTVRPILDRVKRLYEYGMVVTAGFIMGFDGEKSGMDRAMIDLVEATGINMAMVGLLVALPNTQLSRRLVREGRLMAFSGRIVKDTKDLHASALDSHDTIAEVVDQTVAGLNFITTRDRIEIFEEYERVVRALYQPRAYFDRALRLGRALQCKSRHRPGRFEIKRMIKGFFAVSRGMRRDPAVRWLYWRNLLLLLHRGPVVLEQVVRVMAMYLHFKKQTAYLLDALARQRASQSKMPPEIRQLPKKQADQAAG